MNALQTATVDELLDELQSRCSQFCAALIPLANPDMKLRYMGNAWHLSGMAVSLADVLRDRAAEAVAASLVDPRNPTPDGP